MSGYNSSTVRDRHAVTIYMNRKPYMENPLTPSHLTLSDIERSKSRSLRFQSLISCKGAELGHRLLLNINRKAYMGSPMTLSHFTLSDIERLIQGHSDLEALYLIKEQN